MKLRPLHIGATGSGLVSPPGDLWTVSVNTPVAAAVLKIYNDTAAVAANLVASIDASVGGTLTYGVYCDRGIFWVLTGGNADITIGYR